MPADKPVIRESTRHLRQCRQDEQKGDQGVQSSQGNRQAESCEQRQRDDGPVVDQVDATGSGLACAFQIVGEARIFKALQSLPAIGSLHHLFGDVAS